MKLIFAVSLILNAGVQIARHRNRNTVKVLASALCAKEIFSLMRFVILLISYNGCVLITKAGYERTVTHNQLV